MDKLVKLRKEVDKIDESILKLLGKRFEIARKIGHLKKENKLGVLDSQRWQFILKKALARGKQLDLPASFVKKIYRLIHQTSVKMQKGN